MVQQRPVWVSWSGGIGAPTTIPLKGGKRNATTKKNKTRKSKKTTRKGRKATRRR